MAERLVLDASAALAILRDEPVAGRIVEMLAGHVAAGGSICVPAHFWLEVTNVLVRHHHSTAEVLDRLQALDEFSLQTVDLDRTLWLLALARSSASRLTTYDATYLALTEVVSGSLLTLDAALTSAAGAFAVPVGPHRLAETSAPYDAGEPERVWAEFGGYLAQVRREALGG